MSKYEVTVQMPVEITFTIDDTKLSDWDGRSLMQIHENGERWATGDPIPRETALAYMAAQIIDQGRLGGTDGFADFADDATSFAWPHFFTEDADVTVTALANAPAEDNHPTTDTQQGERA